MWVQFSPNFNIGNISNCCNCSRDILALFSITLHQVNRHHSWVVPMSLSSNTNIKVSIHFILLWIIQSDSNQSGIPVIYTCLSSITWLASSLIGKGVPSSDSKEFIGDNVPLVRTIHLVLCRSENAYKIPPVYTLMSMLIT